MNVRREIEKHAAPENVPALLWLLDHYGTSQKWPFVARCEHIRYGTQSWQTHRRWIPTREGAVLYKALAGDKT